MNIDPVNFSRCLPSGVKPNGDACCYRVQSRTKANVWYLVDVETLQCECPRATVGVTRRAAVKNGGSPAWDDWCGHLKRAAAYDWISKQQ